MANTVDPTESIRVTAAAYPDVVTGTSCNQASFKAGKGTYLFIGPGSKGQGYKAMFKLKASMPQARKLAAKEPGRFQVGSTGWVTTRFTKEKPLPKSIWQKWLTESYELCCETGTTTKKKTTSKGSTASKKVTKKAEATSTSRRSRLS